MKKETLLEIKNQIEELKGKIEYVSYQMQELRESIRRAPVTTQMLPVSQPYIHPWWKYQWGGPLISGDNLRGQVQASGSINLDTTGSGVSGTT